jgi:hypothetical protein
LFISSGSSGDGEHRDIFFYFPHANDSTEFMFWAVENASRSPIVGLERYLEPTTCVEGGAHPTSLPRVLFVDPVEQVAGLFVVSDFLSKAEHDSILHELGVSTPISCGGASAEEGTKTNCDEQILSSKSSKRRRVEWESLANRKVAHFNRRFYYGTNGVGKEGDEDLLTNQELPEFYKMVRDRLVMHDSSVTLAEGSHPWPVPDDFVCDQLTVNHYEYHHCDVGASQKDRLVGGIARHVDAHSPFGDVIMSVSLASYTIMEFQRWEATAPAVNIYLPPRALLIMTGEARYSWTHCIAATRVDYVSDTIPPLFRGNRLSLTWRKGRDQEHRKAECICPALCDGVV